MTGRATRSLALGKAAHENVEPNGQVFSSPFVQSRAGCAKMGILRFVTPKTDRLTEGAVARAYMAGIDGVPWQGSVATTDDGFSITRREDESGLLHIAWRVEGEGAPVLCTGSLMERDRPYLLQLELARGTLHRLRNHIASWEQVGLILSSALQDPLREAHERFVCAATSQDDSALAAAEAERSIDAGMTALALLMRDTTEQVLAIQKQRDGGIATLLVAALGDSLPGRIQMKDLGRAFPVGAIDFAWAPIEQSAGSRQWEPFEKQVESLYEAGMRICGGPLLRLSENDIPDWLFRWENDFENIESFVRKQIEAVVARNRGKVSLWHAVAGIRESGLLKLSAEEELRLVVTAIETTRICDPTAPIFVSFDQPWAETMVTHPTELAPLHLADALVRAGLGLTAVGLEINLGGGPHPTMPRDLLEFSRQIDRWSTLGLPLIVLLSATQEAARPSQVDAIVSMLLAKSVVQVIIWNRCFVDQTMPVPEVGLFDADGKAAPTLETFRRLRETYISRDA